MNEVIKEAIKNLVGNLDYLNKEYNEEFGEDSPYKLDEQSDKILREAIKDNEEKSQ